MRQLSGLDALFLNLEQPNTPLHVASIIVVDPSTAPGGFGYEQVLDTYRNRLHKLPPFRWRLVETPFGLDHPYWIDDPNFDLEYHVRRIAVPPPGDPHTLSEIISRIHARPLDRARPLWETYVIEGMADDTVVIYSKNHHAAIDGVSGADILGVLLDLEPKAPVPGHKEPMDAEPEPSEAQMLVRSAKGLVKQPLRLGRMAARSAGALPLLGRMAERAAPPALKSRLGEGLLGKPRLQAPPSPFNGEISPHRRFAYGAMPLKDLKRIKDAYGCKLNDVVMALTGGALRRYLARTGDLGEQPLQAMVPISVRTDDQKGAGGNAVNAMIATLPTHLDSAQERLANAATSMDIAKTGNAVPATVLRDFTQFATPALAATAARTVARLRWADRVSTPFNVVVSNVPGPPVPLYLAGAQMQGIYPVSAIYDGLGLNVTVFSYRDEMQFGIVADREMVDDIWGMMQDFHDEMAELTQLAETG
ncbi:WS/DGAT/MGAT family O-acyltransferase [Euzebya tangerina]|uniref:WS/DGAT/MGAT family O-acyltransferase n=1 Tax=Euzebya tangerina TaxID=591198 RepID=UPI000E30D412|nr:wax ester/triacylglycerol synthase family O-acyltransferase [Euzebya tangerina]